MLISACLVVSLSLSGCTHAVLSMPHAVAPSEECLANNTEDDGGTEGLKLMQTKMALVGSKERKLGNTGGRDSPTPDWVQVGFVTHPDMKQLVEHGILSDADVRGYNGEEGDRKVISRTIWQKSFRCSGATQDTCEECGAGEDNCWDDCKTSRCVKTTGTGKWNRFLSAIHILCESEFMSLEATVNALDGGSLALFWDEKLLEHWWNPWPNPLTPAAWRKLSKQDRWIQLPFTKLEHPGGHTLTMEFTLDSSKSTTSPKVEVGWLSITEDRGFETCMDTKMCLNELEKHGQEGQVLRTSNALLLECLSASSDQAARMDKVGGACEALRKCLDHSLRTHLIQLLNAAVLSKVGDAPRSVTSPPTKPSGSGVCLNPSEEDPMSWECDCYAEMKKRCAKVHADNPHKLEYCLRAQFCTHKNICPHWAKSMCGSAEVLAMQKLLKGEESLVNAESIALVARTSASGTSSQQAMSLEHTAGHKACA
eukprot:gnl/TRDRNA2_/TRDRNA2_170157_c0_seq24.p1 gnl/TRDRNA2_/TRDRNA2_170157_c0~~gnl/TRDRNA2_/TRDRNA2_170157_c0_seq24.p1  ORF type:complete len:481 (+),score=39.71 gnl/TRDRNA2_/TRDRNA2_170157_c0_seq24:71-1513(+)